MSWQSVEITPYDTFIFRDGRPFNQDDEGAARAATVIPPPPSAIYGAVRVAAARSLGWSGSGDWTDPANWAPKAPPAGLPKSKISAPAFTHADFITNMGKGPAEHGAFKLVGPFLGRGKDVLFPAPANLYRGPAGGVAPNFRRARFSKAPFQSDLEITGAGAGSFVESKQDGETDLSGCFVDMGLVAHALGATVPGQGGKGKQPICVSPDEFLVSEARVGLARDDASRQAIAGQLYQQTRMRLRNGYAISAIAESAASLTGSHTIALGSENRPADIRFWMAGSPPKQMQVNVRDDCWTMLFLTPLSLTAGLPAPQALQAIAASFGGTLAGAAISGIDARGAYTTNMGRQAQSLVIRGGSILYIRGGKMPLKAGDIPGCAGEDTVMGYGRFLIGSW